MTANVENMFSVREVPWHGIGTILEDAPTSKDALIYAGLDWKVESKPIMVDGKVVKDFMANVRSTDESVLGIVSNQYKIVQNDEAFAFADSIIQQGDVRYETAGSLANGKRVWLLARLPEFEIAGDKTTPFLVFTNNHDGKGGIKVAITPVRVVCQNTLNIALSSAQRSWTTNHIGNINDRMEEARRTLGMTEYYLHTLDREADRLASITLNENVTMQLIENLIPIPKSSSYKQSLNLIDMRNEVLMRFNDAPDLDRFRNTGWGFVNAVSDFVTHRTPKRTTDTYQERLFEKVVNGHPMIDKSYALLRHVA